MADIALQRLILWAVLSPPGADMACCEIAGLAREGFTGRIP
ncbi:MAG TPA: hypothetical protein VJP88_04455 [Caulobacteraceae bacterium]|nr:hypothetical protein [Caulobacteraceae bacterium]